MLAVYDRLAMVYRRLLVEHAARLDGPGRFDMFLDFYFDLLAGAAKPRDDIAYDALCDVAFLAAKSAGAIHASGPSHFPRDPYRAPRHARPAPAHRWHGA